MGSYDCPECGRRSAKCWDERRCYRCDEGPEAGRLRAVRLNVERSIQGEPTPEGREQLQARVDRLAGEIADAEALWRGL